RLPPPGPRDDGPGRPGGPGRERAVQSRDPPALGPASSAAGAPPARTGRAAGGGASGRCGRISGVEFGHGSRLHALRRRHAAADEGRLPDRDLECRDVPPELWTVASGPAAAAGFRGPAAGPEPGGTEP